MYSQTFGASLRKTGTDRFGIWSFKTGIRDLEFSFDSVVESRLCSRKRLAARIAFGVLWTSTSAGARGFFAGSKQPATTSPPGFLGKKARAFPPNKTEMSRRVNICP